MRPGNYKTDYSNLTDKECNDLITENLKVLESLCKRAAEKNAHYTGSESGNDALELFNKVIDKLKADNFRAIRSFQGRSGLRTYFRGIVSFTFVDLVRKRRGRGKNGDSLPRDSEGTAVKEGIVAEGTGMVILPDPGDSPEDFHSKSESREKQKEALQMIRKSLSDEEILILTMRFPLSPDRRSASVRDISRIVGISEKAVYKRIGRLLSRCRKILKECGIEGPDLFYEKK